MTRTTRLWVIIGTLLYAAVASPVAADAADGGWCTFYSDDSCEQRAGSTDYSTHKDGILQNGGPYLKCAADELSLISYPPGGSKGEAPDHCKVFSKGYFSNADGTCQHLDDLGFTTGDGAYYRISTSKTCSSLSKRETHETNETIAASSRRSRRSSAVDLEKRDANYLTFYDDPGCEQQTGSTSYATHNQGCFVNGGACALYYGDGQDWHLEEYAGVDKDQCSGEMTNCIGMKEFVHNENVDSGCRHLDSVGLRSGFGSYKIACAGCP
jgi:hypothetical protein